MVGVVIALLVADRLEQVVQFTTTTHTLPRPPPPAPSSVSHPIVVYALLNTYPRPHPWSAGDLPYPLLPLLPTTCQTHDRTARQTDMNRQAGMGMTGEQQTGEQVVTLPAFPLPARQEPADLPHHTTSFPTCPLCVPAGGPCPLTTWFPGGCCVYCSPEFLDRPAYLGGRPGQALGGGSPPHHARTPVLPPPPRLTLPACPQTDGAVFGGRGWDRHCLFPGV